MAGMAERRAARRGERLMGPEVPLNVLSVEDDPVFASVLSLLLAEEFSAAVTIAGDCAAARLALSASAFDLITLDYQLPDGDGLELLEEIGGMEDPPLVVMVTGHGDEQTAVSSFKLGAAGYVVKDSRLSSMLPAAVARVVELSRASRELREGEERFRSIVESSHDAIITMTSGGEITYWSPAAESMFGYSSAEAEGKNAVGLLAPEDKAREYRTLVAEHQATGISKAQGGVFEGTGARKDGTVVPVEISSSTFHRGGELTVVVTIHDVSERKRAEQALAESEGRVKRQLDAILEPEGDVGALELSDIIDSEAVQSLMDDFYRLTNIGVAVVDMAGKVLVATGWQDICTKFHRVHPQTLKSCLESDISLSAGVAPGTFKLYKCKNNMWDMATPITVGGKRVGSVGSGQFFFDDETPDTELFRSQARQCGFDEQEYLSALDRVPRWSRETVNTVMTFYAAFAEMVSSLSYSRITLAREHSQKDVVLAELGESEEKYRTLYESNLDGIVSTDIEGRITGANQAYLDMLGYSLEEVTQLTYEQLTPERWHAREQDLVETQIMARGYSEEYEKEYIRKDGSVFPVSLKTLLVRDEDEKPTGMWAFVRDITERKRAKEELERKNAELDGYAHTVSHDLKGPIAAIGLVGELLQKTTEKASLSGEVQEKLAELLSLLSENVGRSMSLIEGLLTLAEAGQVPSDISSVDIRKVVERALEEKAGRIKSEGISVEVADDMGQVRASPTHMYQLFSNLIGNAIAHNDSPSPSIQVSYLGDDDSGGHRYLVRDNGSGIPAEDLEKIFIPFFKGKAGDTGIGLSTVEKIVRVYGGEIRAYNDDGACFEFTLKDYEQ